MIIDFHTHVHPLAEQARPFWKGRCPATIENVIALHEAEGLDISVISSAGHYLRAHTREEALPLLVDSNDYMAQLCNAHEGKVVGLATAIPGGGPKHLKEVERAIRQNGLKGVLISSSHRGAYPDDDDARDFFHLAAELDVPVMMHPPSVGFGEERMSVYRLASSVGRPFDNCLALARLIVRGVLEEVPRLKLVASHLGGGICEIIGRLDYAYELGDDAEFLGSYEPMLITRKPGDYLKMIYMDTTSYHPPAIRCAVETIGADKLVLGTDAPMLLKLKRAGLEAVRGLGLPAGETAAILGGNARRLLKL